ncbi:hypothetical protein [Nannocystis punicea]|uniref:Lipoprotein n=1 Tax=Nannocystis punicea TaxID=2995304 RepID=A0ABY7H0A2_9BACT|nr:hypothetical protein [Nannocystis poenicansa]WAS92668.1 hypothetical protein O0S08_41340 [Nannocystis poenicansa]
MRWWPRFALVALCLTGPALAGCSREAPTVEAWPEGLPRPQDAAEAERLEQAGTRWTNHQARQLYLERVAAIGGEVERWKAEQIPVEEQARRAYQLRHDARMTARAMMSDATELGALQERDRAKYGNPDGPTFEWLIERARAKGLEGDAAYQSIVESAQKTDAAVNKGMGF